jgi:hypothetical protein
MDRNALKGDGLMAAENKSEKVADDIAVTVHAHLPADGRGASFSVESEPQATIRDTGVVAPSGKMVRIRLGTEADFLLTAT